MTIGRSQVGVPLTSQLVYFALSGSCFFLNIEASSQPRTCLVAEPGGLVRSVASSPWPCLCRATDALQLIKTYKY